MDAYLSKPLQADIFFETIEETLARKSTLGAGGPEPGAAFRTQSSRLFANPDGDMHLQREVAEAFLQEGPQLLANIQNGVARCDCRAIMEAAHALKGALAQIGAESAFKIAGDMETSGRAGNLTESKRMLNHLEIEMDRLRVALDAIPLHKVQSTT